MIHEKFARVAPFFNDFLKIPEGNRYWVIPYGLFLFLFALYFVRFYIQLPKKTALRFTVAGIVYVGAAIGIEILTSFLTVGLHLTAFGVSVLEAVEETTEMCGVVLFIRAILLHIQQQSPYPSANLRISFHINAPDEMNNGVNTNGNKRTFVEDSLLTKEENK